MRFAPSRRRRDDDDRVLPLINIVFLLLIFFMLAGQLTTGDPFAIEPATSVSETQATSAEARLLLGPDGRVALNGTEMDRATAIASLAADPPEKVILKADRQADSQAVISLLAELGAAGIESAELLTSLETAR